MSKNEPTRGSSLFSTFKSVMAAFIGVQSDKNRHKDFAGGKFWHFAVMGLVATLLFIFMVWGAVQLAMSSA